MHATAAARAQPRWVPPLPSGWEAKFDPAQRTYFFINHQTRTTQWEDPRFPSAKPAPTPSGLAASSAAASLRNSGSSDHRGKRLEAVPLKIMDQANRSHQLRQSHAETSLTNQDNARVVQKLQAEFPAATRELISDMFTEFEFSESRTRQQLKDLGFGPTISSASSGAQSASSRTAVSPNRTSQARSSVSPARQTQPKQQAQRALSPEASARARLFASPKKMSDTQKDEIKSLMETLERQKAALSNERKSSQPTVPTQQSLLPAGLSDSHARSSTSPARTGQQSSQPTVPTQQSLLPAGLSDSHARSSTSPARSGMQSGDGGAGRQRPQHSSARSTSASRSHGDGRTGAWQQQQQHQRRRTQPAAKPRQKRSKQSAVVTTQPAGTSSAPSGSAVETGNRTTAQGPNPDLRRGPDSSLLVSEYTQAQGRNVSLRQGPDRDRVAGPQGCSGPDLTNRCGPQPSHLAAVSPSGELVTAL